MKKNIFSTLAVVTTGSVLGLICGVNSVQAASFVDTSIIGIDFDTGTTPPPLNWNQMRPSDTVLSNLIDENGDTTEVTFSFMGSTPTGIAAPIPPTQIPAHSPSLEGLDGFFQGSGLTTFVFSNLEPGAEYLIWVFSFNDSVFNNQVSFISISVPDAFEVEGNNELYVNGELGNSSRTLESYALKATAWPADSLWPRTIKIQVEEGLSSDVWGLAGLAIQRVPPTIPEPSALLSLGLVLGVMGLSKKLSKS